MHIHNTATVTLTLAQWNALFISLFHAEHYCEIKEYPQTALDTRALRTLIEEHNSLRETVREAFAKDFPELRPAQQSADEAEARKAERLAGEKADRETLTF